MLRVLLVDDEPSIRLTMAEFLRRAGYEPRVAADYRSGAELAAGGVDLAVVDINLPGRSGIDLLRELNEREPYVPVIMITGEPNMALVPEIVRAGAYDFLAKPVVKETLLKAVGRAAEKKRLVEEKQRLEDEIRRHAAELERRVEERTQELVEVYRALAHQEKIAALGRVAAQVAHEVKNPLAGLLLYAAQLRSSAAGKLAEKEGALLDKIIDTINHLNGTCERVLDFARPIRLTLQATDLNRIVADVLNLAGPQLEAARVETRLELAPEGARHTLDESSMRSALMNLVLNATHAMRGGGRLCVKTSRENGATRIEMADTGEGMTSEQLKRVFEPFYTTKHAGLGLGMPFAKKVVEQHRGRIEIESRAGEGTRIRITLPADAEADER